MSCVWFDDEVKESCILGGKCEYGYDQSECDSYQGGD
jgi:hypothetical protein